MHCKKWKCFEFWTHCFYTHIRFFEVLNLTFKLIRSIYSNALFDFKSTNWNRRNHIFLKYILFYLILWIFWHINWMLLRLPELIEITFDTAALYVCPISVWRSRSDFRAPLKIKPPLKIKSWHLKPPRNVSRICWPSSTGWRGSPCSWSPPRPQYPPQAHPLGSLPRQLNFFLSSHYIIQQITQTH